jgi:hypothetical protein
MSGIGVTQQDAKKANTLMSPLVRLVDLAFAMITGVAAAAMFLLTGVDLLYISVPPIRRYLLQESVQTPQYQSPMQQGNYYGEYGQAAPNMMRPAQQSTSSRVLNQWISDEAKAAVSQVDRIQAQSNAMGNYANAGMGQGVAPVSLSMRSILVDYFKKRSIFLVFFGIVVVLFSTTIFTQIGIDVGQYLMTKLTSIH